MALAVGAVTALTAVTTGPGSAAPSAPFAPAAEFGAGTGTAIALAYKVNPVFGNLSFGITAGESVAGHQNTAATGQSKSVNLGVIGVTLAAEGCDGADPTLPESQQPQPVVVGSDDPGADQGKQATLSSAVSMFARATKAPFAEAVTTVAPLGDPALALISGGTSTASSGVVAPGLREARAVTHLGSVQLLNGLVGLGDMTWEAIQRTGAKTESIGSFHLGSLTIGGQKIELPADGLDQLKLLDELLSALGLEVKAPQVRQEQGIVFVDPMKIGIVPSQLRDGIVSSLLGALQPVRETLTDLIAGISCGADANILGNNGNTIITVLDLVLGTVSGAGSTTIELGGVQATTAEIAGFQGLGQLPALPDLSGPAPSLGATPPAFDSTSGFAGGDLASPPALDSGSGAGNPRASQNAPTQPVAELTGDRGGALLGVGAAGLLLLLATAEGDRRKMRRAQREIPLEA
jgi:hypothetical protein